jgi:hypothetical protein
VNTLEKILNPKDKIKLNKLNILLEENEQYQEIIIIGLDTHNLKDTFKNYFKSKINYIDIDKIEDNIFTKILHTSRPILKSCCI